MSARIAMLRDALAALTDAALESPAPHSDALTRAICRAVIVHEATRFVPPNNFPAVVSTRSGATVTLHALHDGRLIGSFVDEDGLQLHSWAANGTLFGFGDPDDFDLVLPADAPMTVKTRATDAVPGVVVVPFLGRVS
jgi:hypothetical protein